MNPAKFLVGIIFFIVKWGFRFIKWAYFPPKERPPVYEIINKEKSVAGAYTIHSIIDGVMKKKSQFPQAWSQEDIDANIREAFKDGMKRNPEQLPNGYYRIIGYGKQRLPIEIIFNNESKKVKKAHPYI